MSVITVTRQFGAGGSRVARLTAEALGWTLIDNEFVTTVAERAGLPADTVAAREERAPTLLERVVRALAAASPEVVIPSPVPPDESAEERIVRVTEHVIAEAAREGRAVLVGHAAQFVVGSAKPDEALHVYVVAPREARIRTIAERESLPPDEAATRMDEVDAGRDRYVERWYERRRQDPANYHLVVNTGWLGYEGAARVVAEAAEMRGWGEGDG